jgi:hypothetical protein
MIILEKIHFREDLYAIGKTECTEKCAVLHRLLCIRDNACVCCREKVGGGATRLEVGG